MQVTNTNPRGEDGEVGVLRGVVRRGLSSELIELDGGDAGVHSLDDLLGDADGVDELGVEAIAELGDAGGDLVEVDGLLLAVALENIHGHDSFGEGGACGGRVW